MKKKSVVAVRKKQKAKLEKECKALWHKVVCKNANGIVEIQSVPKENKTQPLRLCGHHIVRDGNCAILRYDPQNGAWVDYYEHCKIHNCGDIELKAILVKKRGVEWLNYLAQKKIENEGFQWTIELLEKQRELLLQMLA